MAGSIALATVSVLMEMLPILAVYKLIAMVAEGAQTSASFLWLAGGMSVAIALGYACFGLATRQSHIIAFNLIYDLRMRLANHLARLTLDRVSGMGSGEAKQTIITEPEKLELMVAHAIPEGASAMITWLVMSCWLFYVDWRMALAAIALTPIAFICMSIAIRLSYKSVEEVQRSNLEMNAAMAEFMAGLPVVKMFNATLDSQASISRAIIRLSDVQSAMGRAFVPMGGSFYALILANITVILTVGVWLMHSGEIDLTTLLFFVILGANYSTPLMRLFDLFHHFAHISITAVTAQRLLDQAPQHDSGDARALDGHRVQFDGAEASYVTQTVLHDICMTAEAGTTTALVGPSGSGKSTLARLIPRLLEIDRGSIAIAGRNTQDIGLSRLMADTAMVFQDPFLFTDTVAANIRYGDPEASDAEVRAAAEAAQAHGFITALPQGYDTVIGQGQQLLSGGERQRIAIARAMLKKAPIVILDEATAFTDPDNETEIQAAISALTQDKTLIVIAHRLHTITHADNIVVLDQGRIVAQGRHATLLTQEGLYAQMWRDYTDAGATILIGGAQNG
nr:ABC transporter ATP-binding protein [Shimia sp. R11_0]